MLGADNTVFIAISTIIGDADNFFNRIIAINLFHTRKITTVCDDCRALGINKPCIHNRHVIPTWLRNKTNIASILYGDDDEDVLRETSGIQSTTDKYCFSSLDVERTFALPRLIIRNAVRYVLVAIDPCAGSFAVEGKHMSDFAIVSICDRGTLVGAESFRADRTEEYLPHLLAHLRAIRKMEFFSQCTFVIDVESGTGMEAGNIQGYITREFQNVVCLDECQAGTKPGTKTTEAAKLEMMQLTSSYLTAQVVRVADTFVSLQSRPSEVLAKMKQQLLQYERILTTSTNPMKASTVTFSGKGAASKLDDLAVTLQRAFRTMVMFLQNPVYSRFLL